MAKKVKVAVLVSGGGTNLQALIDAQGKALTSGEIAVVISSKRGAYALCRAENAGIPAVAVPKAEMSQSEFEQRIDVAVKSYGAEVIVLAGFLSILSEDFTKKYPKRIINIHPSLIPAFCGQGYYGLMVHEAALSRGVKLTGATVHYVNEIPDGGEIIIQKAVEVSPSDTPESLQLKVMREAEWVILPQALEIVCKRILSERQG